MAAPHAFPDAHALAEAKRAARGRAIAARDGCDPALGAVLTRHILQDSPPPPGAVVALFWPMPGEIDIRPLLHALHARGQTVLLPRTPPIGQPLSFHRWTPEAPMRRERFGTAAPDGPEGVPEVLFVPLLAFDRRLFRLGYGGGYYDRTLAALPGAQAIGCGFAAQELDAVPVGPYDIPLSAVATERGIIR